MHPKRFNSDLERQQERRVRNTLKGMTTQGKPRRRRPNLGTIEEARNHRLKRNLARYKRQAEAFKKQGLRSDGKPFRRNGKLQQWKRLRATMTVPPVSFEDAYTITAKTAYAPAKNQK